MVHPVKRFAAGGVSVSVWENEGKQGSPYYTVSLQKRYLQGTEWKNSHSLRVNDVPKAVLTLQKAFEFLSLRERDTEALKVVEVE